jgi:hypothetical protein
MNPGLTDLPATLQERVQAELKPGEAVVWAGQPDPAKTMKTGFLLWLFFGPWTAFSLFWMAGAAGFRIPDFSSPVNLLFPLFGLPFVLIGVVGMSAPYWIRRKALSTVYVITGQRAFSLEGPKTWTIRNFLPEKLDNIVRREHPDGSGDLVLAVENYTDSDGDARKKEYGFMAIHDVKQVEVRLQHLVSFARSSPFA